MSRLARTNIHPDSALARPDRDQILADLAALGHDLTDAKQADDPAAAAIARLRLDAKLDLLHRLL